MQAYIQALRGAGAPVRTQIIQAAAAGIVASSDRTVLVENGGNKALSHGWALSLDVSVNKAEKDHLRKQFQSWYADQVRRQLEDGTEPKNVKVDTKLSAIKTPSAKWLVSMYT